MPRLEREPGRSDQASYCARPYVAITIIRVAWHVNGAWPV